MNLNLFSERELKTKDKIILYPAIASFIIITFGLILYFLFSNLGVLFNLFLIALFVGILPYFTYRYLHHLELKDCEKRLPVFLNDLKEAKASGISFPDAIKACRGNYGKLNKYIDKLKKDISWGISIDNALEYMRKNLEESRILSRSLTILHETYRSGGNVEEILESLVNSLLKVMESEEYRNTMMKQHVFLMYGIFLMYAGLIIILGKFLLPFIVNLSSSQTSIQGITIMKSVSPCTTCKDAFCLSLCGYYNTIGLAFGFGEPNSVEIYYKSLFFTMILIQGFFTGIIAGQISASNWLEGIKHGLIMFFLGFFILIFVNTIGLF